MRTGRPARRASEETVAAVELYLRRRDRFGRQRGYDGQRLSEYATVLAMWRELSSACVRSPVLHSLSSAAHSRLEQEFSEAEQELADELGRPPRLAESASYVASWHRSRDPIRATAMRQVERLQREASQRYYWSGVPRRFIPYTGLRPGWPAVESFWRWYDAS